MSDFYFVKRSASALTSFANAIIFLKWSHLLGPFGTLTSVYDVSVPKCPGKWLYFINQ